MVILRSVKKEKVFPSHWGRFFPSVCLAQAVNLGGSRPTMHAVEMPGQTTECSC